jgi:hypothetical protein
LVRCFAGCETSAIVAALGLSLSDLFASPVDRTVVRRLLVATEVEAELQAELERIVARESDEAGFEVATLVRHRNAARNVIERRLSVQLKREAAPWYEIAPHAVDPAWAMCVDQALAIGAATCGVALATFRATITSLPRAQHRVLLTARRLQRELAMELNDDQVLRR